MGALVLVFAVTLGVVLGSYWWWVVRPEGADARALRAKLRWYSAAPRASVLKAAAEASPERDRAMARLWARVVDATAQRLERAHVPLEPRAALGGVLLVAGISGLAVGLAQASWQSAALVTVAVCGAAFLLVQRRERRRLAAFERRFPDAIDLMVRALRAGHALPSAFEFVGLEASEPVRQEFRVLFEHQNYGLSLESALRAFAQRMPLADARFFVTAVLVQREVGGNLADVLETLAQVIRERFRVARDVRVASAHGRITGVILGLFPFVIAAILVVLAPAQMRLLIDDPLGRQMLVVAVSLQLLGVALLRYILRVKY